VANHRRQGDADGLEDLAGAAGRRGTDEEALIILQDLGFDETIEIGDDVGPFEIAPGGGQSVLQLLAKHECQERTEGMSPRLH